MRRALSPPTDAFDWIFLDPRSDRRYAHELKSNQRLPPGRCQHPARGLTASLLNLCAPSRQSCTTSSSRSTVSASSIVSPDPDRDGLTVLVLDFPCSVWSTHRIRTHRESAQASLRTSIVEIQAEELKQGEYMSSLNDLDWRGRVATATVVSFVNRNALIVFCLVMLLPVPACNSRRTPTSTFDVHDEHPEGDRRSSGHVCSDGRVRRNGRGQRRADLSVRLVHRSRFVDNDNAAIYGCCGDSPSSRSNIVCRRRLDPPTLCLFARVEGPPLFRSAANRTFSSSPEYISHVSPSMICIFHDQSTANYQQLRSAK
jgi:hypothetical protein